MTQLVYSGYVTFQTNGDYSEFHINFPDGVDDEFVEEYRKKLLANGFPVFYPSIPNPKALVFNTIAMKDKSKVKSDENSYIPNSYS